MSRDMRDVAQILPVGRIGCRVLSGAGLAAMPDASGQNVPRFGKSFDLARNRTCKLVRRTPTRHPRLDVIKRNSATGRVESVEPPPVLGDADVSEMPDFAHAEYGTRF